MQCHGSDRHERHAEFALPTPSLQGTRHHLLSFIPKLETAHSQKRIRLDRSLLKIIVHKVVPDRPGRSEPRVTKRRPKAYPRLTKPRYELRHQLQTA
ncbi:MAG: hypothetical protein KME52_00890 [Desmonostoc geniculatum HA4340-LM1]|jgi:hypothetical protein|nr:hypothetical protein [Desmonostoc geniculatum HA4340-LM1]